MNEPDKFGLFEDEDALAVSQRVTWWWLLEFLQGRGQREWGQRHAFMADPLSLPWGDALRADVLLFLQSQYAALAGQPGFESGFQELADFAVHVGAREASQRFGGERAYIRRGESPMRKKHEMAQLLRDRTEIKDLGEKLGMTIRSVYTYLKKK